MDMTEFRGLRAGLTSNLPAARGEALAFAEAKLLTRLQSSNMFTGVEVDTTEDRDNLLVALLRYRPGTPERQVASYLEAVWVTQMRVEGLDAFTFLVQDGHVELRAVTGDKELNHFLTLHLIAQEGTPEEFEARDAAASAATVAPAATSGKHKKRRFGR